MTSEIAGLSRNTINFQYSKFRERILLIEYLGKNFDDEVEVDESYFGARRIRSKRGRGAKGKIPVVGLLTRGGKVYIRVIANCQRKNLLPIIKARFWKKQPYLLMAGNLMTNWFLMATTTTVSTIQKMNFPGVKIILTVLNLFGVIPKED